MKTVIISILVVLLVAGVGVGAFFVGQNNGLTQAQNIRNEFFQSRVAGQGGQADATQRGQGGQGSQGGQFGRPTATGTVKSIQGNTIQVTMRDGSTVNVTLDGQTVIQKTSNGTKADIQPGQNITIMSNQTGENITAQVIQIRAAGQ